MSSLFKDYSQRFDATASPYYQGLTSSPSRRVMNATLALCSEASELLEAPSIEEMGDCFWYLALLCRLNNFSFEDVIKDAIPLDVSRELSLLIVVRQVGLLASLVKKSEEKEKMYVQAPETRERLVNIAASLLGACRAYNLQPQEVLDCNLAKLSKRHVGGKFNPNYKSTGENL